MTEQPLPGGLDSDGSVVRVADTVRRPERLHSATVRAFLLHLRANGFDAAPLPLGHDAQGRQVLTYLPGDVAHPPYPAWAAGEPLLRSVAALQRRLHEAAEEFTLPDGAVWQTANLPSLPAGANLFCHNDLCVENVVVREGRAVGVIDFDFAAPSDRLFDIAVAARHWVPVRAAVDLPPSWTGIDRRGRFEALCAVHDLDDAARVAVLDHVAGFLDRALVSMRERADQGRPRYLAVWRAGYEGQNRRSRVALEGLS